MAEFQEVMRQRDRMCETVENCGVCPLRFKKENGECVSVSECAVILCIHTEMAEKAIMDWAAEHPEPQYPTWQEWQNENFPNGGIHFKACDFDYCDGEECPYGGTCESNNIYHSCRERSIPAYIAEKLGIKLKEVE